MRIDRTDLASSQLSTSAFSKEARPLTSLPSTTEESVSSAGSVQSPDECYCEDCGTELATGTRCEDCTVFGEQAAYWATQMPREFPLQGEAYREAMLDAGRGHLLS